MDKSVWKWKHNGDTALFAIHVDDIVTAPSSDSILEAFAERLRERFGEDRVTGGDEMTEMHFRIRMTVQIGWLNMLIATTAIVRTRGEVPRV